MKEIWKDFVGYEDSYQISSKGRVKSKNRLVYNSQAICGKRPIEAQVMKQYKQRNGYMNVCLSVNGDMTNVLVHRAVAKAFIPNPNNLPVVDHIDGDKTNNDVSNLRWVTFSENCRNPVTYNRFMEAISKRTYENYHFVAPCIRGAEHYKSVAVVQLDDDYNLIKEYDTVSEAARAFGTNIATNISYCCKGKRNKAFGYKWMYKSDYYKPIKK